MSPRHPRLLGLLACVALAGLLLGLPAVLIALGWGSLPANAVGWAQWLTSPDDGHLAVFVLKVAAWVTWALLAVSITTEIAAAVRGIKAPHLPGLRWSQRPARRLVALAALLFISIPTVGSALANPTPASAAPSHTVTAPAVPTTTAAPSAQLTSQTAQAAQTSTQPSYTVRPGDSLWSIAEHHLGSGHRYPEIIALNAALLDGHDDFLRPGWVLVMPDHLPTGTYLVQPGDTLSSIARAQLGDESRWPEIFAASQHTQADGGALADPDLILPGWTLTLPQTHTTSTLPDDPKASPTQEAPRATLADADGPTVGSSVPAVPVAPSAPVSTPAITTTAPVADPASQTHPQTAPDTGDQAGLQAPWLLVGLTGAGAVLAAGMFGLLRRRRQAQFRARRPGRAIATPPAAVAPVEKTIMTVGAQASGTLTAIDQTLRTLATNLSSTCQPIPDLASLQVRPVELSLQFAAPVTLPAPWRPDADPDAGRRWTYPLDATIQAADGRAPYPQLVTVGQDDDGTTWMVNLEQLGTISLTGDPTFASDFARYLAAEIAVNPWASEVHLDCIGVAGELADLDVRRIHHQNLHDRPAPTDEPHADMISKVAEHAATTIDRCTTLDTNVPTGRASDAGDELWPSRLLLVNGSLTTARLDDLLSLTDRHPQQTGTTIMLVGDGDPIRGIGIRLTSQGRVQIPTLHLDLIAVGLTPDEAAGCTMLLSHADTASDVAMPTHGEDGWRANGDAAGALRADLVLPRNTDPGTLAEPASSLLPGSDETILDVAAVTEDDLQQLAPLVPAHVRERVETTDPTLDADVAAWLDPDCPRPRLHLLGPIQARIGAPGNSKAAAKRRPFYTEILAFLALHPDGVSVDQLVTAFGGTPNQIRKHITALRDWLGSDPTTGQRYLPDATQSPAAQARGTSLYQLVGVLVDADLFRRLRLRGEARGPEGIADLRRALDLVDGEPFSGQRDLGWAWLTDSIRIDQHMVCAIVDVAHLVATAALTEGDLTSARAAVHTALAAAPYEDTPQMDLAAITAAEGDHAAADRLLFTAVANRSDDGEGPLDLNPRTAQILDNRHRWKTSDQVA